MNKGLIILCDGNLVSILDNSMQKSIFGWILGGKEDDRTVLRRKKGKFYRLASVKKDYSPHLI
ncbi:MAG: hypothetical protein JW776_01145 [Candidatus Lokiarchaeota archaeon]|nr:hypothetical protein [Candidatus Lokiarchaeota archaeon]